MKPQATFTICGRVASTPERKYYSLTDPSKFFVVLSLEVPSKRSDGAEPSSMLFEIEFYNATIPAAEHARPGQILRVDGFLNWKPYTNKNTGKSGIVRSLVGYSVMQGMLDHAECIALRNKNATPPPSEPLSIDGDEIPF